MRQGDGEALIPASGETRREKHSFCSAADFAAYVNDWKVAYEQLSRGRFAGELTEVFFDSIQIIREQGNQALLETGTNWEGSYTVGVVHSTAGSGRFQGLEIDSGHLATLKAGQDLTFRFPPEFDVISATVDINVLQDYACVVADISADELDNVYAARADALGAAKLRESLLGVLEAVMTTPSLLEHRQSRYALTEEILDLILENTLSLKKPEHGYVPSRMKCRTFRKARDFMLQNVEETISIADVCRHLGVSRRTLQYCFQDLAGLNPVAYLRLLRLNGARRDLLRADPSVVRVGDVLASWGFWHWSRFAAQYKTMFGELPSETLGVQLFGTGSAHPS